MCLGSKQTKMSSPVCNNKRCPGFKIQKLVPFLLEKFTVSTVVSKVLVWWCKECEAKSHYDIAVS